MGFLKKILEYLNRLLPFELKRPTSVIAVIIALLILGFLSKAGEKIFDLLLSLFQPLLPVFISFISLILFNPFPIKVNLFNLILFIFLLFPLYRFVDKKLLQTARKVLIFQDDFSTNKGWALNYWGSNNPAKTCRLEDSKIVFEAEEADLIDSRKENGAFYDLKSGIYAGSSYEVSCWVRSAGDTTMGFQLWVHDTTGNNDAKFPSHFYTPSERLEKIIIGFFGSSSNALRIHLHTKAGKGKIIVKKVEVMKV